MENSFFLFLFSFAPIRIHRLSVELNGIESAFARINLEQILPNPSLSPSLTHTNATTNLAEKYRKIIK